MSERLRHKQRTIIFVLGGIALSGVLVVVSATGVSMTEENDAFCATCHLNPERAYVDRSETVGRAFDLAGEQGLVAEELWQSGRDASSDLASAHRAAAVNCVACHRGDNGLGDRTKALALGGRNTVLYVTGQFDPDHRGVANASLVEASCNRCHVNEPALGSVADDQANPVVVDSFENHFHSYLFDPQYVDLTTVSCLDCHPSHLEIPPIVPYFIDEERVVFPACVQCHIDVQMGPLDL